MRVMLVGSARLPDSLIGKHPVLADILADSPQNVGTRSIDRLVEFFKLRRSRDYLAIDVELQLIARPVAEAHRTRIAISRPVCQVALGLGLPPINAVHH